MHARLQSSPRRPQTAQSLKTQQQTPRDAEVDIDLGGSGNPDGCEASIDEPDSAPGVIAPEIPRKEVIQPQLPLRLPCYDFTPIIDPTFDGCLPEGLAHRLRVLPTFVV